jgi:hypothetical protein
MRATATPPTDVRCNRSNALEQGRLRLALFRAWGGRCAWCRVPLVDASYAEIDHIVAQKRFDAERAHFKFSPGANVHDVENLAPVCAAGRSCNQTKGDRMFSPAIWDMLHVSRTVADDVRRRVRAMRNATGLDRATTTILGAALTPQNRRVLSQWGDLLVQRVHAVDPNLSTRYLSVRYLYLEHVEVSPEPECMEPDPTYQAAVVELDAAGRDAYTVAKIMCGTDLDDIITEALATVVTEIDARIADVGVTDEETDGGFSLTSRRMLSAHSITAQTSAGGLLTVTGKGSLLSSHTAAISWVSDSGERLDDQSDVEVDGTFTFSARTQVSPVDFEIEVDHTWVTVQRQ